MQEKLTISTPIIVEGKYDKIALCAVANAYILTTDGFGLFNQKEKAAFFRRLAEQKGVIVLTDADGGGKQIRSYLAGILPKEKVKNLYIPAIPGKERRKEKKSRSGLLGVEGMDSGLLRALLLPFADGTPPKKSGGITKRDFYLDGLSGKDNAKERRCALCLLLGFPPDMTANALLEAINLLYTLEEYKSLIQKIT